MYPLLCCMFCLPLFCKKSFDGLLLKCVFLILVTSFSRCCMGPMWDFYCFRNCFLGALQMSLSRSSCSFSQFDMICSVSLTNIYLVLGWSATLCFVNNDSFSIHYTLLRFYNSMNDNPGHCFISSQSPHFLPPTLFSTFLLVPCCTFLTTQDH